MKTHRLEDPDATISDSANITFDIAVGKFRNSKSWHNKQISWEELKNRCRTTHRTSESYAEYMAAPKSRQDEIKDIGGFVGGHVVGGSRKKDKVSHRQLVTLDIDWADPNFWEIFCSRFSCAALIYSTHKHCPEKPRLRLLIPLDREVSAAEYEPIARKIASILDIEQFDHTTFEINRLMYWASTARDGEFIFQSQEGHLLNADDMLAKYTDWNDLSSWPKSDREVKAIHQGIRRQGDPLEKDGPVGAWCRTYSIHDVIEKFLSDAYEPCDVENRYTYKGGSTYGGMVTYDDKFSFSHHSTDPTSGKLCNAFDLVRIHKFGMQDENIKEDTPSNKLPSYQAMLDFVTKDPEARKTMAAEKLQEAGVDFAEEGDDWLALMDVDRKGNILSGYNNVEVLLRHDPKLKGKFGLNEFSHMIEVFGSLPWGRPDDDRIWGDLDWAGLRRYVGKAPYNIKNDGIIKDCLNCIAYENRFHSIVNYLDSLVWDGIERLETLFVDYLGAENTVLNRAMTRKSMTAAVARVKEPGKKFDHVLTFISSEGAQKSTLLNNLGRREWFLDTFNFSMLSGGNGKMGFEQIQNKWIIEIQEMAGLRKAEIEAVKGFITSREDYFRPSHKESMVNRKRQCVFFGTSNNYDFLSGSSGNRRFWPMPVRVIPTTKKVVEVMPAYEIDQIWAEAVDSYNSGEPLYLDPELEEMARELQNEHTERDPREEKIQWFLDKLLPANWDQMNINMRRNYLSSENDELHPKGTILRTKVCAAEIWQEAFEGKAEGMTANNTRFINTYLRRKAVGWEAYKTNTTFAFYGQQRGYRRVDKTKPSTSQ